MRLICFCCIVILITASCKKKTITVQEPSLITTETKNGLPEDFRSIDCYLYSSYTKYSHYTNYHFTNYCTFSDPRRNLMRGYNHFYEQVNFNNSSYYGNVDVGAMSANNMFLSRSTFSPNVLYAGSQYVASNTATNCHWLSDGNRSFKALDLVSSRTYPELTITTNSFAPIKKSQGLTIDLSGVGTNYDSLIVSISDASSSSYVTTKTLLPGATSVTFKPSDFSVFYTGTHNGIIGFYAFNYSHKIIDNKIYVFELAHKISRNTILEP